MEQHSDPLTDAVLKHPAGVKLGMVLVGLVAAGVLANKKHKKRSGGGAVRG
ncbi:MAG TPA: hypothetical protein VGL04_06360 [Sporichthyaceae bacterium]|jgi:hypothetical protein